MKLSRPLPIELPDYGVLFAESVHAPDFRMSERADPYHKLVYVLAGSVEFQEAGRPQRTTVPAGSVIVVPEGLRHAILDREPSTLLLLCLDSRFMTTDPDLSQTWSAMAGVHDRRLQPSRPARLRLEDMWRRAMIEGRVKRTGGGLAVRALAAQILVLLSRSTAPNKSDSAESRVTAVIREVDETFYDEWSLDHAAVRAAMSRRHFSSLFRQVTGSAFQQYLCERRLIHAARLLEAGEHSVVGVMFSCGYNDVSTFYRQFKKRFRAPPRIWMLKNDMRPITRSAQAPSRKKAASI